MAGHDDCTPMCRAVSQPGAQVTVFLAGEALTVTASPGRDFICTRHRGHSACDGRGHILARWPRARAEQYWTPDMEKTHSRGRTP